MTDLLQQGVAAARAGRRDEARKLLLRVVQADERSEQGWLWLSGVVDDPADIRTCLLNVLDINPSNQKARQGLAWVEQRYGSAPAQPAPEPPQSTAPEPPSAPVALERAVGTAYTKTTVGLQPVPAPPSVAAPAPPPRRAPSPPTERFRGPLPGAPEPVETAPEPRMRPASQADERPRLATPPPARQELGQTALYPTIPPVAPAEKIVGACPYCGSPTTPTQKRCTQCRNDLMLRAAPPAQRTAWLTALGTLWGLGGVLMLLLAAGLVALFFLGRQATRAVSAGPSDRILIGMTISLVIGLLYLGVARGLLARQRWAYYVNIALVVLNLVGSFAAVLAGAALASLLIASVGPARSAGLAPAVIATIAAVSLGLVFVLVPAILTVLSYGDFVGPLVRFHATVEDTDHATHYNNGIAYRDRGMWFMAAQEWQAAARKKPRETNYLHALGLAYARLKRFDQARSTLDAALRAAPDNPQIKESRALVDQLAAREA